MKITIVAGARPNFMKIAPITRAINSYREAGKDIVYRLVYTGSKEDESLDASLFSDLDMEFLNDRYASMALTYDLNGKLFNRIPLLKSLKWREIFRIRGLYGTLTDKNNPYKSQNSELFLFPMRNGLPTSRVMDNTPYMQNVFSQHSIPAHNSIPDFH